MDAIQWLPVAPASAWGNGASNSVGGLGTTFGFVLVGDLVALDTGVPPTVQINLVSASREVTWMTSEEDKYNVEKFIENEAKVFIGETDPMQAENWINVIHTAFRGSQVPNWHKTQLVSCMH